MEERIKEYYIDKDFNCAESTLRLMNEKFQLGLCEDALKAIGGFGGGMCCEKTCGALCASIAAISSTLITERAHATENFKETCAEYVALFERELGSCCCAKIKETYFKDDDNIRCIATVEKNAKLLEGYLAKLKEARGIV